MAEMKGSEKYESNNSTCVSIKLGAEDELSVKVLKRQKLNEGETPKPTRQPLQHQLHQQVALRAPQPTLQQQQQQTTQLPHQQQECEITDLKRCAESAP
eukprot:423830-Amphidinium_carterae.1